MRTISVCAMLLAFSESGLAVLPVFTDVNEASSYFGRTTTLKKRGITTGCSYYPLMYCPGDTLTRGQAAVLIVRSLYSGGYGTSGYNAEAFSVTGDPVFADVDANHLQYRWIQKMGNLQLTTSGCGGGNFCPEGTHTYAELAVFMVRAWQLRNGQSIHEPQCDTEIGCTTARYADVPIGHWAYKYIEKAQQGLVKMWHPPPDALPAVSGRLTPFT